MIDPRSRPLRRRDLAADPLAQLRAWIDEAAGVIDVPEAMALATASASAAPSVRMVLLKGIEDDGIVFFSGYTSRKGAELEANPQAALLFYWHGLGRQARVEGTVVRTSAEESRAYFETRPLGARLAAAATAQGAVVASREELEARVAELEQAHPDGGVALPRHWGGYRLTPAAYEFWQHRENRLHDRFRYRGDGEAWTIERLAP